MKHNLKISLILICMFIVTQLIGLAVVNSYLPVQKTILNETTGQSQNITVSPQLPYGTQPPEITPEISLTSIIIAMVIAVLLIFLLMRIRATMFLRIWFFLVVVLAMAVTFNSLFLNFTVYSSWIALILALPLGFYKIFRQNFIVHNLTELLIYPGLAAIFVAIFNIWTIIIFLILISIYDMWAVWKSKIMIKMAKFQINELKLFGGFFLPYANKDVWKRIRLLREKYKNKRVSDKTLRGKKIKVNLAILGGGDVVFPLIASGVILKVSGLIPALIVTLFAVLALLLLFIFSKKGKSYPAMPFLTAGVFIGMLVSLLI